MAFSFFRFLPTGIGLFAGMVGVCILVAKEGKCSLFNQMTDYFEEKSVSFDNERNISFSATRMDGLMRHYSRLVPEKAFEELKAILDSQLGQMEMGQIVLLYYLAYKSGRMAVPYLIQWVEREDLNKGRFLMPAVRGWLGRDSESAVQFMQANKKKLPQLLKVLLDKVNDECATDPDGVRSWIFTLDEESRNAALVQWLNGMACFYPGRFFDSVRELPDECFKDFRICGLISSVGCQFNLADTEEWMKTLLRSQKSYAMEVSLMRLAKISPDKAKEKFDQWSREERKLQVEGMIIALAKHNLRDTLDWSEKNFRKSPYFRTAVPMMLRSTKISDRQEITCDMLERKNSEIKDCIVSRFVEENLGWLKKSDRDARKLVELVMNIGEEYERRSILDYVVSLWAEYSPSGTEKWIRENESLRPEKREHYLSMCARGAAQPVSGEDIEMESRYQRNPIHIEPVKPFLW